MRSLLDGFRNRFLNFVEGRWFLPAVALLILTGHLTLCEFWLNAVLFSVIILALCLSDSIKPLLTLTVLFMYQVTVQHAPAHPAFSDYYFSSYRLVIVYVLLGLFVASVLYYALRTHFFREVFRSRHPLLWPILALCAAFLLNGVGYGTEVRKNLVFGLIQVGVYFFHFYLVFIGFSRWSKKEVEEYLLDMALAVSWVVTIEIAWVFLKVPDVIHDGFIVKDKLMFGWGISNSAGAVLSLQTPLLGYGVFHSKRKAIFAVSALLSIPAVVATQSRTATIFVALVIFACLLYGCACAKHKGGFRCASVLGIATLVGSYFLFPDLYTALFSHFIDSKFYGDNRFVLWEAAWRAFLEHPFFGAGFFDYQTYAGHTGSYTDFFPYMAHNTPCQMLGSCGALGLLAYLWMRVKSLFVFLKKPSAFVFFLFLGVIVFLGEGLLDVFPFIIYPVFYYNAYLAAAYRMQQPDKEGV